MTRIHTHPTQTHTYIVYMLYASQTREWEEWLQPHNSTATARGLKVRWKWCNTQPTSDVSEGLAALKLEIKMKRINLYMCTVHVRVCLRTSLYVTVYLLFCLHLCVFAFPFCSIYLSYVLQCVCNHPCIMCVMFIFSIIYSLLVLTAHEAEPIKEPSDSSWIQFLSSRRGLGDDVRAHCENTLFGILSISIKCKPQQSELTWTRNVDPSTRLQFGHKLNLKSIKGWLLVRYTHQPAFFFSLGSSECLRSARVPHP